MYPRIFCEALILVFCALQWAEAFESGPQRLSSRASLEEHGPLQRFVTRPDIVAPRWDLQIHDESALSPGYWFVAPYRNHDDHHVFKWTGPLIYDQHGGLIWSGAPMFDYLNTFDFRGVVADGKQMASLIIHDNEAAYILDNTYELYTTVSMVDEGNVTPWIREALGDEKKTNFHDFSVIDDGARALLLTRLFENATIEESKLIGYEGNCSVRWQGFKEIDLNTNDTIFEWNAHGRISLDEGTFSRHNMTEECSREFPDGWGLTHLNSIDRFANGDYIISARHTDTIYKVSHIDGSIIWRLGGIKTDFEHARPGAPMFSRQHHARIQSENRTHTIISLFDNAHSDNSNDLPTNQQSRGLILALDTAAEPMTATIIQEYRHPQMLAITKRGSMQILPNNNAFICWADSAALTEHAQDGRILMEAHLKLVKSASYRGYKVDSWIGKPTAPPDVNATVSDCNGEPCTLVHVSWNGATEVAVWNVYRTNANGSFTELASAAARSGFETRILFEGDPGYVFAEALNRNDEVLGRSELCEPTEAATPSTSFVGGDTLLAFMLGIVSTVGIAAAVWLVRWRRSKTAKYEPLSDSEGDSDLEDEEFENLQLVNLPPASSTTATSRPNHDLNGQPHDE